MTISTTIRSVAYSASGSSAVFAYTFKIIEDSDLKVYQNGTLKTLGAGAGKYTVSGAGSASGGNVTFGTTPSSSDKIVIVREVPRTQATDLVENSALPAATLEDALDKLTMIDQEVDAKAEAGFRFADSVSDAGTTTVSADSSTRASKVLAFDSSGGLSATQELGEHQGNWAASTAYVLRDIVKDTNNNNQYICITAHTSSGAVPISTNTDAAKWRLLVDAASATTAKTGAETAQAASEAARDLALSYRNTAETHKNSAETAKTASETAKTASETAKTASETARDLSQSYRDTAETHKNSAASSATAAAASADTVPTPATIKDGAYWGYVTTGSSSAYVLVTSPTISSYAADMWYHIKANHSNTGASTINVDSVGAKNIKKYSGSGIADLTANDLEANGIYTIVYDGTQFILIGGGLADTTSVTTQTHINAADIFLLNARRLSAHSSQSLNVIDGFVDTFSVDGTTQNSTALNLSSPSANMQYDASGDYWTNTQGAAAKTFTATGGAKLVTSATGDFDATGSGTASASHDSSEAANLFDGSLSSKWGLESSDSPACWWKYDFGSGVTKTLTKMIIYSADSSGYGTANFTFEGSNNDSDWTVLSTQTGQSFSANTYYTYTWSNSTAYRYYRQNISQWEDTTGGTRYLELRDVQLIEGTVSPKFGTAMLDVATGGDNYISAADHNDWDMTTDFAIDFWMNHRTLVNSGNIILQYEDSDNYHHLSLSGTTALEWKVRTGGSNNWAVVSSGVTITAGTWFHVALVMSGSASNVTGYLNGTRVINTTVGAGAPAGIDAVMKIGGDISAAASGEMDGWIDEFRFSNVDRGWTGSTITVPSSAHTNDANTKLLLHMDGSNDSTTFTDSSAQDNLAGTFQSRVFGGTNMPPLAGSAPSNLVLEIVDKRITGTPTYYLSRDGGSNWQTVSSWDIEDTLADGTVCRLADVTMTATSGTSPMMKIVQGGTAQDYRLYSLGLKYK